MRLNDAVAVGKALASTVNTGATPGARDAGVVARTAGAIYGGAVGTVYPIGTLPGAAFGAQSFGKAGLLGGAREMQQTLGQIVGEQPGGLTHALRTIVNAKRAGSVV